MKKRVLISTGDVSVRNMFKLAGWEIATTIEGADLICFTGGADISPFLYGQKPHKTTSFSSDRDNSEISLWKSVPPHFPKVGICRGAQLGNVLCGGTLWQHVDGHMGTHPAYDMTGLITNNAGLVAVSSIHHQMCRVTKEAYVMCLAAKADRKEDMHSVRCGRWREDVEAFFYDNFNFMGVQFHPEYGPKSCTDYFFQLLDLCYDFNPKETPTNDNEDLPFLQEDEDDKRVLESQGFYGRPG